MTAGLEPLILTAVLAGTFLAGVGAGVAGVLAGFAGSRVFQGRPARPIHPTPYQVPEDGPPEPPEPPEPTDSESEVGHRGRSFSLTR